MTVFRSTAAEIGRFIRRPFPLLVMFVLMCIPLLYSGLYLTSNWDPYGSVDRVPAALVMNDRGTDDPDEHYGRDLADELIDADSFDWKETPSAHEAREQVQSGQRAFALVIGPNFSQDLTSPEAALTADGEAQAAQLTFITNDANNYILSNIVSTASTEIRDTLAHEVGETTADSLLTNLSTIGDSLDEAADGASELHNGASQLTSSLGEFSDGVATLSDGLTQISDGAQSLANAEDQLVSGQKTAAAAIGTLNSGAQRLNSSVHELDSGAQSLASGSHLLSDGAVELAAGTGRLVDGAGELDAGAHEISAGLSELNTKLETSPLPEAAAGLTQTCQDIYSIAQNVDTEETLDQINQLISDAAAEGRDTTALENLRDLVTQLQDSSCITDGVSEGAAEISQLLGGVSQLNDGAKTLAEGTATLETQSKNLHEGASTLREKTTELTAGADTLAQGTSAFSSGARKLSNGTAELESGSNRLLDGQQQAAQGAHDLSTAATTAAEGGSTLSNAAGQLESGSHNLETGSTTLASELASGADEIPSLSDDKKTDVSQVMSNPIETKNASLAEAGTYGEGMAPFFTVLSLWIGVLILGQFLHPLNTRALASNTSSFKIALGSWLPYALLGLAQSVFVWIALRFGLDYEMAHPIALLGMFMLTALVFSALVHGLIALLGAPGKLIALVLLILQLVTAGGMMPVETLPGGFKMLHSILPMGYALTGVRRLSFGVAEQSVWSLAAILVGFLIIGLILSYIGARRSRTWKLKDLQPEIAI